MKATLPRPHQIIICPKCGAEHMRNRFALRLLPYPAGGWRAYDPGTAAKEYDTAHVARYECPTCHGLFASLDKFSSPQK